MAAAASLTWSIWADISAVMASASAAAPMLVPMSSMSARTDSTSGA